jgi:AcrR family transcriptional regulator
MSPKKQTNSPALRIEDGRRKPRPGPEQQSRVIVDAAVSLFLEHGVRSVSVMQICDQADVSRSTFYRCFDDMDALVKHIYQVSVFDPVITFMQANFGKQPTETGKLKQALNEMFDAIFAQGNQAELVFREANDPNSPAFQIVNQTFDQIVNSLKNSWPPKDSQVDAIFLKAILNANQWIAHDAIQKGLSKQDCDNAKSAAWQLVSACLDLQQPD